MKIILGTPRSGTTYVANWISEQYPEYERLGMRSLGEIFHPDFFNDGYGVGDNFIPLRQHDMAFVDTETLRRISLLPEKCVFKLHPGQEMSKHIWEFIADRPIIMVERKDILGQFISIGIGYHTNKWVSPNMGINGLQAGEKVEYKRVWFDDLAQRLIDMKELRNSLIIERVIYHEQLPLLERSTSKLPKKQNHGTNEDKLKNFTNSEELLIWYNNFMEEYNA
jgi:hypothetical protein